MKRSFLLAIFAALGLAACSQNTKAKTSVKPVSENTLLWRISGNGLTKPSYLFGTMHIICANDIVVSDSLKSAIKNADNVYLELPMDDLMGMMFGAMAHINMREDTSLSDLLTPVEYKKVKDYFEQNFNGMLPFKMMEKFKPFFTASLLAQQGMDCESPLSMENLIMEEAKENDKKIKGLETVEYQLSIFDSIPYQAQAKQLVKMIDETDKKGDDGEMKTLTDAYRNQELKKLDELTRKDESIDDYADLLLYNRNANWAKKLQTLMASKSLVIAVGAGHLPGEKGVINLLRKAGYKVEPVQNEMIKKGKEI